MTVGAIWSESKDHVIGNRASNSILWRYRSDMRRFKAITYGGAIIMGRKTYDSIGKALPGRASIVLTKRGAVPLSASSSGPGEATSIATASGLNEAIDKAVRARPGKDIWIIGGGEVYFQALALGLCDVLDITTVPDAVAVDAHAVMAPTVEEGLWRSVDVTEPELAADGLKVRRCYRAGLAT